MCPRCCWSLEEYSEGVSPEVAPQLARVAEATEVADLGEQPERGERADATKRAQPTNRIAPGLGAGDLVVDGGELGIDRVEVCALALGAGLLWTSGAFREVYSEVQSRLLRRTFPRRISRYPCATDRLARHMTSSRVFFGRAVGLMAIVAGVVIAL